MITLRPWQWRDVPQLIHICNNIHIWNNLRDQMPKPYRQKDAEEWVRFNLQQQPQRNFCIDENGVMIGGIGMVPQHDIYKRNIEIGYYLGEEHWGRGHGTEAVRQMVRYIFDTTDCYRIYAEVFAHNLASMAVLRKNGFHREAVLHKAIFKNDLLIDAHLWVRFREE
ncbi:GNAT family N-acetyltransferase [Dinghuibacter silviterrae]|uniref:RimJ/RimL family protein N-acetyltransferase n=1 Tax=Dinghuibacter silviterrae TaxID=1539049 RepID=A0A4R8DQL5_9BACT|nr:GNAT family N-acetyltransferase [Dinghuibacter silviterrae]TDW99596.1 RimJ/RimL family protein N-acetyltransferase [Dinghuibacter silviterrae]